MAERQVPGEGEMRCPSCGAVMGRQEETCPGCGVRIGSGVVTGAAQGRTAKPVVGGVLGIVAGVAPLIAGIVLIAFGATVGTWDPVDWVPIGIGIGLLALGLVTIVGSSFAIARRNFPLAVAGGVCALFSMWMLGIPALVLIAVSSKEFE
jgi:hypothetical protein